MTVGDGVSDVGVEPDTGIDPIDAGSDVEDDAVESDTHAYLSVDAPVDDRVTPDETTDLADESDGDTGEDVSEPTCAEGREECNGECVNLATDSDHCGECFERCGVTQICDSSRCREQADCREDGCPSGYYCNLADGGCLEGCLTSEACGLGEYCDSSSRSCQCDSGYHECGGVCTEETNPDACGEGCRVCPSDDHGDRVCRSGQCQLDCEDTYQVCDGGCAACPIDAEIESWACDGASCEIESCSGGYHACGDTCEADDDINACGADCVVCPTPGEGMEAVCNSGSCEARCADGLELCKGRCTADVCEWTSRDVGGYRLMGDLGVLVDAEGVIHIVELGRTDGDQPMNLDYYTMADGELTDYGRVGWAYRYADPLSFAMIGGVPTAVTWWRGSRQELNLYNKDTDALSGIEIWDATPGVSSGPDGLSIVNEVVGANWGNEQRYYTETDEGWVEDTVAAPASP